MRNFKRVTSCFLALIALYSCQQDEYILDSEVDEITTPEKTEVAGFYLLNEGNMGSNTATIDYMDFTKGLYNRNIYFYHKLFVQL